MDRDKTKKLLPIMQAYVDGKTIQTTNSEGEWIDVYNPEWFNSCKYRIKPEKRRMTYRELAEWLAKGNGEAIWGSHIRCFTTLDYDYNEENDKIGEDYKIRKWGSDEWREPVVQEADE